MTKKEKLVRMMNTIKKRKAVRSVFLKNSNDVYKPFFDNRSRYLVLKGGGGSGKSIFCGQKIIERLINEPGHRILVVRKVAKTLRQSCFQQLKTQINDFCSDEDNKDINYDDFNINKGDLYIQYKPNGNEIIFAGLDDVEKLKSIANITMIWIEEASEIDDSDFNQLDIRLRGQTKNYKQFLISFNPVSITHWLKTRFFDYKDTKATISETTYKDNRFLDDEAIAVLENFKEKDPYYYMVYCLGQWGILGKTVFNAQIVTERLLYLRKHSPILKQGQFVYEYKDEKIVDSSVKWVDDENGPVSIFKDVEYGYPYVIGGDTSGEGSDYFVGDVVNNVTGVQVAQLRHQVDEDLYARQMYCLGKYYNNALIGIETNYSTFPTKELTRLGYVWQYMREHLDNITGQVKKSYGFQTNKVSRPLVIAELVALVREQCGTINSLVTLDEMLTFIRNEKTGKPEAQEGKHDDTILSLAIAHFIRSQQTTTIAEAPKEIPLYFIDDDGDGTKRDRIEGGFYDAV